MGFSIRDIAPHGKFSSAVTVEALSQAIPAEAITTSPTGVNIAA